MAELHDPTRDALSEAVTALVRRHGGPTAVARILSVDRSRVHAWMKGDIGIDRLGQLSFDLDEPVVVRFGPQTDETSPPAWAEGLAVEAAEKAITRLVPPDLLEQVPEFFRRIEAFLRQAAEDAHEEPGSQGPAGSAPQGRTDE